MVSLSDKDAIKIGMLALCFTSENEFNKYYEVSVNYYTIFRDFKSSDLLCGIMLKEKDTVGTKRVEGVHLNIMKNGDIFARYFPYYDGQLEVIAVYNQREIFELAKKIYEKAN